MGGQHFSEENQKRTREWGYRKRMVEGTGREEVKGNSSWVAKTENYLKFKASLGYIMR